MVEGFDLPEAIVGAILGAAAALAALGVERGLRLLWHHLFGSRNKGQGG